MKEVGTCLPDFISPVLVADGQQIQQDFIEVAQGKVDAHYCYCIAWGHLRARCKRKEIEDEKGDGMDVLHTWVGKSCPAVITHCWGEKNECAKYFYDKKKQQTLIGCVTIQPPNGTIFG